jgi:hypothetical protein
MHSYLIRAALLGVLFAAATAALALHAHNGGSNDVGTSSVTPSAASPSQQAQVSPGSPAQPTLCCPPSAPAAARHPLRAKAINHALQAYLDALLHHDLGALKTATCPRLRHTEVGVALHGKYIRAWSGKPYDIASGVDFVTVRALVKFTDPATGQNAGHAVYAWNVERGNGGRYYVCGFLS